MADNNFFAVVVDIETTGLDAAREVPLEVGLKIVDAKGEAYAQQAWLVYEPTQYYHERILAAKGHGIVGPMHKHSGLWDDLENIVDEEPDSYSREYVDGDMCDWLTEQNVRFGSLPMMGNSVGSLDRPFCLIHFPKFNKALSHRQIDMSTVRQLLQANNPILWEQVVPLVGTSADSKHRVMDDIDACIREYKVYREEFLITEDN